MAFDNNKLGELRPNQIITTFGPGSIVDAVKDSVTVLDTNYWNFRDIDKVFDYYTPTIIANNDFLKDDPDTAKAFLAALSKGYTFAAENPEESAEILIAANEELKDSKDLVVESQKYLSKYYIDDAEKWGVIDPERWNAFYKWLNDNKLVDEELPENAGLSTEFI